MDSNVRRVQPEAALRQGPRPGASRRHRKGTREFAEALGRDDADALQEGVADDRADEAAHVDHKVSPPLEGETGTRIDLFG